MSLGDDRRPVRIQDVTGIDGFQDVPLAKYRQPDITVDTSQRFKEHEVIGGPTVRQKLGRGQTEISISGVVTTAEAYFIDRLRDADTCTLNAHRLRSPVVCHIVSTNTEPISEGGGQDLDGEFTHTFEIQLISLED